MLMNRQGLLALLVGLVLCLGTTAVWAADYDDDYDDDDATASYGYDDDADDSGDDESSDSATVEVKGTLEDQWFEFLSYIDVANAVAARSYGQAILDANKPAELYRLTTLRKSDRWDALLLRGEKLDGLAATITAIRKAIEEGYQSQRASAADINNAINGLGGSARAYQLNLERLVESGEYAMPFIIARMVTILESNKKDDAIIYERLVNVLPRMGKVAVRPLSEVLKCDEPRLQLVAVNALAQIEYPHAAPALRELSMRRGVLDEVKKAAIRALTIVGGRSATEKAPAQLYYELAEMYYAGSQSLQADSRFEKANVWYWTGSSLAYKSVPTAIFTDVYTMRMASEALKNDGTYFPAVSLWLAANLRREANLPADAKDPTVGTDEMPAEFYALASSARYLQDVLARALKDNDAVVATGAIKALSNTVGAKSLVGNSRDVGPLIKALSNGNRQVRFLAATTLANSLPTDKFNGQDMVPGVLNEALRQTGQKMAVVIVSDEAVRNPIKDGVRASGFEVIDQPDLNKALEAIRATSGVDVVLVGRDPSALRVADALRKDPLLSGIAVVAMDASQEFVAFTKKDKRSVVLKDTKPAAVGVALKEALELSGTISAEGASDWAVRAAEAVYLLGLTNNNVIDVTRTETGLLPALDDSRPEVQVAAAKALSVLSSARAQQGIAALAVKDGDDAVRVAAFAALTNSVKKFGNQTTEDQAAAVVELVNNASAGKEIRQAAAATLGAMNLPSEKIKTMILRVHGEE